MIRRSENLLDPPLTVKVFAKMREMRQQERVHALADLTGQEMQILARISEGETSREIGTAMHPSEKPVRNYVSAILDKLGLNSRAQAAAYAARHRIDDYH